MPFFIAEARKCHFAFQISECVLPKLPFDPALLPVDSLAGEPPVADQQLTMDALRLRFSALPPWHPETSADQLTRDEGMMLTPASVLLPLMIRETGLTLLFTQRTAHLTAHAGQVSFPGGRRERQDGSSIETALRETEEEVGLDRRHVEVLGTLPDYLTGTGYRVTPVVALVHPPFSLRADPGEVAEIFEVPLRFLMDGTNHQLRSAEFPNGRGRRSFYAMPYDRFFIWGATAGMLRNLFHFLRA